MSLTITPSSGPPGTPAIIACDVAAFGDATGVTWDGVSVAFTIVDDYRIACTAPAHASGPATVIVHGADTHIIPPGPIARWRLDGDFLEDIGYVDSYGQRLDLGTMIYRSLPFVAGHRGQAAEMYGGGASGGQWTRVDQSHPLFVALSNNDPFTMRFWAKLYANDTQGHFFFFGAASGTTPLSVQYTGSGLEVTYSYGQPYPTGLGESFSIAIPSPIINQWHRVTLRVSGGSWELWLGGVHIDTHVGRMPAFSPGPSNVDCYIGTWAYPLRGILDDVVFFPRALTDPEMALDSEPVPFTYKRRPVVIYVHT